MFITFSFSSTKISYRHIFLCFLFQSYKYILYFISLEEGHYLSKFQKYRCVFIININCYRKKGINESVSDSVNILDVFIFVSHKINFFVNVIQNMDLIWQMRSKFSKKFTSKILKLKLNEIFIRYFTQ